MVNSFYIQTGQTGSTKQLTCYIWIPSQTTTTTTQRLSASACIFITNSLRQHPGPSGAITPSELYGGYVYGVDGSGRGYGNQDTTIHSNNNPFITTSGIPGESGRALSSSDGFGLRYGSGTGASGGGGWESGWSGGGGGVGGHSGGG